MIDETKLTRLIVRLDAMLTVQRGKYDDLSRVVHAPIRTVAGNVRVDTDGQARLRILADEISMLEDVVSALQDAGVSLPTEDCIVAPESTSGDYGASGEEVAATHTLLRFALSDDLDRCPYEFDDGQYGCIMSRHGPDEDHMIRPRP